MPARARQTLANPSIEATCNSVAFPTQQGWPEDCNTWEPAKNILAPLLLREWDASGGIQDSQKQGHMDNAGMFIAFAHTKIAGYPTHCSGIQHLGTIDQAPMLLGDDVRISLSLCHAHTHTHTHIHTHTHASSSQEDTVSDEPLMPGSSREEIAALVASSTAVLPRVTDEQRMQVVEQVQVYCKSRSWRWIKAKPCSRMSSRFVSTCLMKLLQSAMLAYKDKVTHFLIHKVRRNSNPQSQNKRSNRFLPTDNCARPHVSLQEGGADRLENRIDYTKCGIRMGGKFAGHTAGMDINYCGCASA